MVRQQQRREDVLALRARQMERELAKRGVASGADGKWGEMGLGVLGDCPEVGSVRDWQLEYSNLKDKLAKKRVQVVKWKQQAVRCEEARGALEAEVVHVRSLLLEEQRLRAEAQVIETTERRQVAFSQKRIVRLEAELRTANHDKLALQQQMAGMKLHLDHMTVCNPEISEAPSSIGEPSVRSCAQDAATQTAAQGLGAWADPAGGVARKDAVSAASTSLSGPSPAKSPLKVKRRLEVVVEGEMSDGGAGLHREGMLHGDEGRRSGSNSPSKTPRGAPARGRGGVGGIEALATRVSMALMKKEEGVSGVGSAFPQSQQLLHMHEQRRLQQQLWAVEMEVEALRSEAGDLAKRLLLSEQALTETKQALQASEARLMRARQQNAANKVSLQMWDSLRVGEGGVGGAQGTGATVASGRVAVADEEFVRMRRRVGELEIECSQYQERLTASSMLARARTCRAEEEGDTEQQEEYADQAGSIKQQKKQEQQEIVEEMRRTVRRQEKELGERDALVQWVDETCNHLVQHMQGTDEPATPRQWTQGGRVGGIGEFTSCPPRSSPFGGRTAGGRVRRGGGNGLLQQRAQMLEPSESPGHHVILPSGSSMSKRVLAIDAQDARVSRMSPTCHRLQGQEGGGSDDLMRDLIVLSGRAGSEREVNASCAMGGWERMLGRVVGTDTRARRCVECFPAKDDAQVQAHRGSSWQVGGPFSCASTACASTAFHHFLLEGLLKFPWPNECNCGGRSAGSASTETDTGGGCGRVSARGNMCVSPSGNKSLVSAAGCASGCHRSGKRGAGQKCRDASKPFSCAKKCGAGCQRQRCRGGGEEVGQGVVQGVAPP